MQGIAAGDAPALAAAIWTLIKPPQTEKEIFTCSVPVINASASPRNEQEANDL